MEAKSVYGKLIGNREDIIKELGRIQAVDAVLDEQWNDLEVLFSETHRDELLALQSVYVKTATSSLDKWKMTRKM